jgi:hypothetical protein
MRRLVLLLIVIALPLGGCGTPAEKGGDSLLGISSPGSDKRDCYPREDHLDRPCPPKLNPMFH